VIGQTDADGIDLLVRDQVFGLAVFPLGRKLGHELSAALGNQIGGGDYFETPRGKIPFGMRCAGPSAANDPDARLFTHVALLCTLILEASYTEDGFKCKTAARSVRKKCRAGWKGAKWLSRNFGKGAPSHQRRS
jgi:hypothetical protein